MLQQAQTPPAKPAGAQRGGAPAAAAAPEDASTTAADSAEREAAWVQRLASALDINTALEGAVAELQAQNARLRRHAHAVCYWLHRCMTEIIACSAKEVHSLES